MDKEKAHEWVKKHQRPSETCPARCDGVGCYDQQIKVRINDKAALVWASRCKTRAKAQLGAKIW